MSLPIDNVLIKKNKRSEAERSSVLFRSKHIHECLTHEQPDGDADRSVDHRALDTQTGAIRCDASRLGQTRGDEKKHAGDHGRERRAAHLARVQIAEQTDRERADGGDDVRPVEDVMGRERV